RSRSYLLFASSSPTSRHLPSFPTRRSSDLITDQLLPGERYQFKINQSKALPDPASLSQAEGVHGPSQAIDLSDFSWSDQDWENPDRKSTRLNSSHVKISYAVFCLKKKKNRL